MKPLIFLPNLSTVVRGVHRPQAIVLFQSHISSENLWSLHQSTMNDAILDVCHAYFAKCFALPRLSKYTYVDFTSNGAWDEHVKRVLQNGRKK